MPPTAWFSPGQRPGVGPALSLYDLCQYGKVPDLLQWNRLVKVGDTVADIQEGKHAGVLSLGVLEGSSVMGTPRRSMRPCPRQSAKQRRTGPGRSSWPPERMGCWIPWISCPSGWRTGRCESRDSGPLSSETGNPETGRDRGKRGAVLLAFPGLVRLK